MLLPSIVTPDWFAETIGVGSRRKDVRIIVKIATLMELLSPAILPSIS